MSIEGGAEFVTSETRFLIDHLGNLDPSNVNGAYSCVLAEMCAGEPVVAGPSSASWEGQNGAGGRSSWLEAAVELPQALRRTIRALTHLDPDKVGPACWQHGCTQPSKQLTYAWPP